MLFPETSNVILGDVAAFSTLEKDLWMNELAALHAESSVSSILNVFAGGLGSDLLSVPLHFS